VRPPADPGADVRGRGIQIEDTSTDAFPLTVLRLFLSLFCLREEVFSIIGTLFLGPLLEETVLCNGLLELVREHDAPCLVVLHTFM